jgi:plasmid stabilization system protein ParE
MAFRLAARARRDLDRVLKYSLEERGRDAAGRYQLLLKIAMEDVERDPFLPGSRAVGGTKNIRCYSISLSRSRMPHALRVLRPAHQLVYRFASDDVLEILAIVGDSYPAARVAVPL